MSSLTKDTGITGMTTRIAPLVLKRICYRWRQYILITPNVWYSVAFPKQDDPSTMLIMRSRWHWTGSCLAQKIYYCLRYRDRVVLRK